MAWLPGAAVDDIRRREAGELRKLGIGLPKGMRRVFLKRPENLTEGQHKPLNAILNKRWLKTARAYLWKEKFQPIWDYTSAYWARRRLRRWRKGAMRSRLLKKFVRTRRIHEDLILNGFEAEKAFSSGAVEGLSRMIDSITRKAHGFKTCATLKIVLFHTLGHLPEPQTTHRF